MKIRILSYLVALLLVLGLSVPVMAADVAHGKCVNFDEGKKLVTIDEYDRDFSKENKHGKPTGKQLTFNVADALIGITPVPGDVLRIAYTKKGNDLMAVRIMNLTKQDIMKR